MSPAFWQRLEQIYEKAQGVPPAERKALLDRECGDDQDLRAELDIMFGEGTASTGRIEKIVREATSLVTDPLDTWAGRRIGAYRITRKLGSGGMGAVFLAVRDDEYRKEVALKTLKFEVSDRWNLMRFRQERQILAGLEHPNIARLLDGGSTEQGTPFLVMEYVEGVPITEYVKSHMLSTSATVELFRRVCDAVQYAHSKLIVHRDVKPGNILVTSDGTPKLLDFGIAKLLDTGVGAETAFHTVTGVRLMTPEYASPEQVRGEQVSTATDVYALGSVLYELLTGQTPHDLRGPGRSQFAQIVCETEVKPPSSVGGRHLRGDLDNIILKALEKEPARRYRSVEQFSEDLRRYLVGLPIEARSAAPLYRVKKFVLRNRAALAAATLILAALSGALLAEQRRRAEAQQRFQDVRMLANKFIGEFHDEVAKLPGSTKVREMILATALEYLDRLSKSAGDDPALLGEASMGYFRIAGIQGHVGPNLGHSKDSSASLDRALELRERAVAVDPSQRAALVELYGAKARSESLIGRPQRARAYSEKALQMAEAIHRDRVRKGVVPDQKLLVLLAVTSVAIGDAWETDANRSLAAFRKATTYMRDVVKQNNAPVNRLRLAQALLRNATSARSGCFFTESVECSREAESILNNLLKENPNHPVYLANLTLAYQALSHAYGSDELANLHLPEESLKYARKYVEFREQTVRQDPNDAHARFSLSMAMIRLSEALRPSAPHEALEAARRSVETLSLLVNSRTGYELATARWPRCLRALVESLLVLGKPREALAPADESVEKQKALVKNAPGDIDQRRVLVHVLVVAAEAYLAAGKEAAAEPLFNEAIAEGEQLIAMTKDADYQIALTRALEEKAKYLATKGDSDGARLLVNRSVNIWKNWQPPNVYAKRRTDQAEELRSKLGL